MIDSGLAVGGGVPGFRCCAGWMRRMKPPSVSEGRELGSGRGDAQLAQGLGPHDGSGDTAACQEAGLPFRRQGIGITQHGQATNKNSRYSVRGRLGAPVGEELVFRRNQHESVLG